MGLAYSHWNNDTKALTQRIASASVNPWTWPGVLRSMDELAGGSTFEIVAETVGEDGSALIAARLTADGLHFCCGSKPSTRELVRHAGGRAAGLVPVESGDGGTETALLLHRSNATSWFLVAGGRRDRGKASFPRMHAGPLLDRMAAELTASFRVALTLASGGLPGEADCRLAWDGLRHGVVVATPDLQILRANAAAEELLSVRVLFRPTPGRLRPMGEAGEERLEAATARVCGGKAWRSGLRIAVPEMLGGVHVDVTAATHSPFAPAEGRSRERLIVTLRELTGRDLQQEPIMPAAWFASRVESA